MTDELVYVWAEESKLHHAVRHEGDLLSNEACNLDDVRGERHVNDRMPEGFDEERMCRRCFPVPEQ